MIQNFATVVGLAVVLAVSACAPSASHAQDAERLEQLEVHAWKNSWPGGVLQQTVFDGGHTTRFLLLKCCLRSQTLADYMKLTDKQLEEIRDLEVLNGEKYLQRLGNDGLFDEESVDAEYYSFLSAEQMVRVDALCFHLDGYSSLLRTSLKSRLQISPKSVQTITALFADFRSRYVNPRGRRNFAAKLPADIEYQNTWWDGSTATFLNMKILAVLNDDEQTRLQKFLISYAIPEEVLAELIQICELPAGGTSTPGCWINAAACQGAKRCAWEEKLD